jgi:hypothetical protein
MALAGRDKTFAFETCRDVLLKLERELDRYQAACRADKLEDMKDAAFNASVTAWQLCDWVFHDLTPAQRVALNVDTLGALQAVARKCRALHICRQVATASKHWRVTQYPDPDVAVIVTADASRPPVASDPGVHHSLSSHAGTFISLTEPRST